jgi:class 3 adenylate cyclase
VEGVTSASQGPAPPLGFTVTILFSDIRGFTEYTEQFGDEAAWEVLQAHNAIVQQQIEAFHGQIVKTQGDSVMVAFTTARGAVLCAVAIQKAIAEITQDQEDTRIAVGIGINTGEPIQEGGDFFGTTVNLAARLCAAAGPGQILASETTRYVAGRLEGLEWVDLGLHELKGFQEPQRLFEVVWAWPEGSAETVEAEAEAEPEEPVDPSALEGAVQRALGVLNRVLAITHRDDPAFRPLLECQSRASKLRLALSQAMAEPSGYTPRQVDRAMLPYADLLALITGRDQLDDERWMQLEDGVARAFGRGLVTAALRGRLLIAGEREPAPRASAPPPPPRPAADAPSAPPPSGAPPPAAPAASRLAPAPPPPPDPRAAAVVWWARAHAAWAAWKASGMAYAHAVRMVLAQYPHLLGVPITESGQHDGGGLADAYFALLEHVETVAPGFVRSAVERASQVVGGTEPGRLGPALYALLVERGRLGQTYADFVRDAVVAGVPNPGVWVDAAMTEGEETATVVTRPSAVVGDSGEARRDLSAPAERTAERRFTLSVAPLTSRFVRLRAVDLTTPRDVEVKVAAAGQPSDHGWCLQVRPDQVLLCPPRRLGRDGTSLPGLGRSYVDAWVAVFNPDPLHAAEYTVSLTVRGPAPSGPSRSVFSPVARKPR